MMKKRRKKDLENFFALIEKLKDENCLKESLNKNWDKINHRLFNLKHKNEDEGHEIKKENEPEKRTEDGEVRMKGKNDQDQLEGSKDKQPQEKKVNKQGQHTDSGR